MKKYFSLPVLVFVSYFVLGQSCDENVISKIPGKWIQGREGSIDNVTAANLAKEKEMLGKLHSMIRTSYNPIGANVVYGNVFGYNKYVGKTWLADPFEYLIYVKKFRCLPQPKNNIIYYAEDETPTSVYISVNKIWSRSGRFNLNPADLPDDHYDGYLQVSTWPEKKDDYHYWLIAEPTERYPKKEYQYLVTYDGKLPFAPFTRKEYLLIKIPQLKAYLKELEDLRKDIDPNFDAASKRNYESSSEIIDEQKKLIASTEDLLKKMSQEELNMGAIIYGGDSKGEFSGFRKAGELYCLYLVKPNPDYYNKSLPRWVPQFFCVLVQLDSKDELYKTNIEAIEKAIDFKKLKSYLGNTNPNSVNNTIVKQNTATPNQIFRTSASSSSKTKVDIYKIEPTKGFVSTPVQQIKNIVKRPEIKPAIKTAAMAVRITDLNKQEYIKKLLFDIERNLTPTQLKNTDLLLKSIKGNSVDLADLGVMLFYKGLNAESLWCLAQAASFKPDNDYILNNLSSVLNMNGAAARSIGFLRYLAAKHPKNSTVQNNLGQAWFALNELQKSKAALDTCIKYSPYHPQANYTRAAIAETEGKNAEASSYIAKSMRNSYNESSESFATKKGIKLDYGNILYRKSPFGGDYINPYKFLPPPYCESVYTAEKLNGEWLAWGEAVSQVSNRINAEVVSAASNMQKEIGGLIKSPSAGKLNITILNKKADKLYHIFMQKLADLTDEMENEFRTKYDKEKKAIELKYSSATKAIHAKYPDGEGSPSNSEARCRELNEAGTRYLGEMADLNNDFVSRYANPIRQLNIELMRWSQLMGFTEAQKLMTYYERALFAVSPPGLLKSEFVYPSCIPDNKSKTKKDIDLPAPYCPISFRIKIIAIKATGDCSKFDLEIEVEGLVLNIERDFVNKKSTIALGAGLSLDLKNKNESGVSQNEIIGEVIPEFVDAAGAGVGTKMQGFIEFGPDGSISDLGIRGEAGIEGGLTDKGDIKVNGKIGVNSGVNVELTPAAQSTSIGKTINEIISTK